MTRRLGWLALFLLPGSAVRADNLGDAYQNFDKGHYEEAAKGFQDHTRKTPQDYDQLYNSGVALFQKGDLNEASNYFDQAKQSPDPALRGRAAYNKGVAMAQQKNWEQAAAEFQEALSYDNDNKMILDNLEFARTQKAKKQEQEKEKDTDKPKDQKSADGQKGQSADQQNGQGKEDKQKAAEQKPAEQKSAEQKSAEQKSAEQKSAEQKAGEPKEALQEAQQGKDKDPSQAKAGEGKELTAKDLKKQEAEKLLRSVEDRIGTYILTPEQANTEGKSRNGKDW